MPRFRGKVENWIAKFDGQIRKLVFVPAILIVIALLSVNIVDRFVLDGLLGISWVEELCVIILIWLVFLSVFTLEHDDLHIKVQIFKLPRGFQEFLDDLAMSLFLGFLVWNTWALLPRMFSKYAALGWSIKVGYYAIICGGAIAILVKLAKYASRAVNRWH